MRTFKLRLTQRTRYLLDGDPQGAAEQDAGLSLLQIITNSAFGEKDYEAND